MCCEGCQFRFWCLIWYKPLCGSNAARCHAAPGLTPLRRASRLSSWQQTTRRMSWELAKHENDGGWVIIQISHEVMSRLQINGCKEKYRRVQRRQQAADNSSPSQRIAQADIPRPPQPHHCCRAHPRMADI